MENEPETQPEPPYDTIEMLPANEPQIQPEPPYVKLWKCYRLMKLRIMIMTLMIQCVDSVQIAATDEMSPANLVFLLGAIAKQEPTSVSIVP